MMAKVLVVDDDKDILWTLEEELSSYGFDVKTANSGEEALNLLENEPVDYLVIDLKMPDMNGIDLLLKAKEKYPDIKVVVITAYGSEEVREDVMKKGAIKYLEKPFGVDELIKAIEEEREESQKWELTEVLQLIALEGKSADIEVEGKGIIHMREGEVVNASYNDLEGEEAFYKILEDNPLNFNVKWTKETVERKIEKPLYALLIGVVARKDEIIKEEALDNMLKEAIKEETEEVIETQNIKIDVSEKDRKILEDLKGRDGSIMGVGFVDEDGIYTLPEEEEIVHAGNIIYDLVKRTNSMPGEEFLELIIVKKPYLVLARQVKGKLFFIVTKAIEKLGIMRVFLKNL